MYKSVAMQSFFLLTLRLSLLSSANKWIHFVCTLGTPNLIDRQMHWVPELIIPPQFLFALLFHCEDICVNH